jgi:hypothetical protein
VHTCVGLWDLVSVWICLFPARHCSSPERLLKTWFLPTAHAGDIQANRVGRLASQTQPSHVPIQLLAVPQDHLLPKIISDAKRRPPTRARRFIAALHTQHTAIPTIRATCQSTAPLLRLYIASPLPGSGASRCGAHKQHVGANREWVEGMGGRAGLYLHVSPSTFSRQFAHIHTHRARRPCACIPSSHHIHTPSTLPNHPRPSSRVSQ